MFLLLPDTKPLTLHYHLGFTGSVALEAIVSMSSIAGTSEYDVFVAFEALKNEKVVKRVTRHLGSTFALNNVQTAEFTRDDRDQLFITLEMGAVRSWMFDFDGKRLTTPYAMEGGRIHVYPSFDKDGNCQIAELWPRLQAQGVLSDSEVKPVGNNELLHIVKLARKRTRSN